MLLMHSGLASPATGCVASGRWSPSLLRGPSHRVPPLRVSSGTPARPGPIVTFFLSVCRDFLSHSFPPLSLAGTAGGRILVRLADAGSASGFAFPLGCGASEKIGRKRTPSAVEQQRHQQPLEQSIAM